MRLYRCSNHRLKTSAATIAFRPSISRPAGRRNLQRKPPRPLQELKM